MAKFLFKFAGGERKQTSLNLIAVIRPYLEASHDKLYSCRDSLVIGASPCYAVNLTSNGLIGQHWSAHDYGTCIMPTWASNWDYLIDAVLVNFASEPSYAAFCSIVTKKGQPRDSRITMNKIYAKPLPLP